MFTCLRARWRYRLRKIREDAQIEHQIDHYFNHVPATRWRRLGYVVSFAWQDGLLWLTCRVKGHVPLDCSHADPEHGHVEVVCSRCQAVLTYEPLY